MNRNGASSRSSRRLQQDPKRGCINNRDPVEARAARIKSHNALVQTNARWQCYGVGEFTTLKSGEQSHGRWGTMRTEALQRHASGRERKREREIGVAPEEIFARRSRHSRVRSFKSNYKVNLASLQNPLWSLLSFSIFSFFFLVPFFLSVPPSVPLRSPPPLPSDISCIETIQPLIRLLPVCRASLVNKESPGRGIKKLSAYLCSPLVVIWLVFLGDD